MQVAGYRMQALLVQLALLNLTPCYYCNIFFRLLWYYISNPASAANRV